VRNLRGRECLRDAGIVANPDGWNIADGGDLRFDSVCSGCDALSFA
jgi:hypothetical protein